MFSKTCASEDMSADAHVFVCERGARWRRLLLFMPSPRDKLQEFVVSVVPCCKKVASWQLISEDFNNNTINATWTFSAEIVPVCKDDVICIHPRQYSQQVIFICVGVPSLPLLLGRLFLHVRPAMHALACTHTRANVHSSSQVAWISGVRNALQRSELEVHSTLFLQLFHRHVCVASFASTAI